MPLRDERRKIRDGRDVPFFDWEPINDGSPAGLETATNLRQPNEFHMADRMRLVPIFARLSVERCRLDARDLLPLYIVEACPHERAERRILCTLNDCTP